MKLTVLKINWLASLALLISISPGRSESSTPIPLYGHHFTGSAGISQDPHSATLKKIWALPESKQFLEHVMDKLTQAPFKAWQSHLPQEAQHQPALWRPLLDDLLAEESILEVRKVNNAFELTIAIRLNDRQAGLWNTNLARIVRGWKLTEPSVIQVNEAGGWETRNPSNGGIFQMVRLKDWLVLGLARERLTLLPEWANIIAKAGRPVAALTNVWWDVKIDTPQLSRKCPTLAALEIPPIQMQVSAKEGGLRTTARLLFPQKLAWKPESWIIPTNIIGEPIVSFTVARGFDRLLSKIEGISSLQLDQMPNQVCLWGQANPHVQISATIPVNNATNSIIQLSQALPAFLENQQLTSAENFHWVSNLYTLIWRAVPFVIPSLSPWRINNQDYLVGSFFPVPTKVKTPPPELFAQVFDRSDLMYYDWELTPERVPQMNRMWQLIDITKKRQTTSKDSLSTKWLLAMAPLLGNTATEITTTTDQEAAFTRKSQLGLTAFELATLVRWVDSAGFPMTFDPPASILPIRPTNALPSNPKSPIKPR